MDPDRDTQQFATLDYSVMGVSTDNIMSNFKKNAQLYSSVDYEELKKRVSVLKAQYRAKTSHPDKTRIQQIELFELMLVHLPNEERSKKILLGALIYRVYRLKELSSKTTLFIRSGMPTLRELIQEKILNIAHFNELDSLTVYLCCKSYLDYLNKDNNALTYKYIKSSFVHELADFVTEYQKKSKLLYAQLFYVRFILSFKKQLDIHRLKLQRVLENLITDGIQSFTMINQEQLFSLLDSNSRDNSRAPVLFKKFILSTNLLNLSLVTDDEMLSCDATNGQQILHKMYEHLNYICSYALIGAYVFVLKELEIAHLTALPNVLLTAIGACGSNTIDRISAEAAMKGFNLFITQAPEFINGLELGAWGSQNEFERKLLDQVINNKIYYNSVPENNSVRMAI